MRLMRICILIFFLFLFGSGGAASGENGILMVDRFRGGMNAEGIPVDWQLEKAPGANSKIVIEKDGQPVIADNPNWTE